MKLLTFRRLKIKPAAESKNLLLKARTQMNNKQRPRFDRCVSGLGDSGSGYIYVGTFNPGWWSLPGLKDQLLVPVGAKTRDKRPAEPLVPVGDSNRN